MQKMNRIKISYKEIKRRQQEDLRVNLMEYNIYRHVSSPLTYVFLRLGITPNQITIFSSFLCLLGGIFLSIGTYAAMSTGMLLFLLFKVLDDCDGEVARIQKTYSMEGIFIDRIAHYINSLSLGLGLGVGMYNLYRSEAYILIGIAFTFGVIIEHVIIDVLKSTLRKKVINESFNKPVKRDRAHKIEVNIMVNDDKSFSSQSAFSKIFGVYPIQGLLSNDRFYTAIIAVLIIGGYFISMFGILTIYLLMITMSKIIWIVVFIYRLNKTRYITKF